jgi:putative SOS response-associated peptidase YedK
MVGTCENVFMCGRFTLRTPMNLLAQRFLFDTQNVLELSPRYNIAPTQNVLAVRNEQGQRWSALLHWGLIPAWAKDAKVAYSTINARAETLAEKPAFRTAYRRRRCLVLADGYYEWKREGKAKLPLLYEIEGGQPFAFAGLWEAWRGFESCTIITTTANDLAKHVHDRMPVILQENDFDAWLDTAHENADYLLQPFPAAQMSVKPVGTFVNNARNEGPDCIANSL